MAIDTLPLISGDSKPFYVYLYRDPRDGKDAQPIYVGKGLASSGRASVHWIHGARNRFLNAVLRKLRALGLKPVIEIVEWFETESDAHAAEVVLIAKIGRRDLGLGPLLNLTDGGEGTVGHVVGPAQKEKHRQAGVATWASASEDKRTRMLTANALWEDAEHKEQRKASMKAARARDWADTDKRAAHIEASRTTKRANAAKIGAKSRDYYANETPEKRAERVAALTAARQADAEATGARSKEMWSRPGQTEKQSQAIKAGQLSSWADPEKRARRLEKIRATRALKKASKPLAAV